MLVPYLYLLLPIWLVAGLLALGALAVAAIGQLRALFPVMVALGPLMLLQYAYWRRRRGTERTMWQYRHAAPR